MIILFLVQLFFVASAKLCDDWKSVDLSDAKLIHDGTFVKNGTRFPPDYVYSKNVSGVPKHFGCLCDLKKCFRKCCPLGEVFLKRNGTKSCIKGYDVLQVKGLNVSFMTEYKRTINLTDGELQLIHGVPCNGDVFLEFNMWFVQEDGRLYTEMQQNIPPWLLKTQDKYCVDTFIIENEDGSQTTSFDALVCLAQTKEEKQNYEVSSSCMIISCVFILATVGVYGWLPELRNLHGRVLMTYLMCLFVAFACLATMQILLIVDNISINLCIGSTIVIYFSLQSAFFWLNVMCFDIWWTFSGKRGMTIEKLSLRAKFCAYALYAFGIPTLLTAIMVSLEFSGLPPNPFLPMIRRQGCFLSGRSRLLYLYAPIILLWFANLLFFILTAVKITQIKRQTSVLKSRESATHDRQNSERQRLLLYVKLFLVMGINWLLEVISTFYPEANKFWCFTDAYNVLTGLIIFIIFVCKRKIFRLMKKRYNQVRGDSNMSKSQTSTRTFCSTTRDEIGLTSRTDYK
ncbi:G-protein coupled receptor Mth2-like isoform X3 [Pararge aegeria]|uniref:G-protein coupled receptor Mth2-like isoform X3 n=1 Tax=Pararge aegeria TaxID=116150 RepID=UPI0019D2B3E1|nr:G-protein coupled receptor Mth2-like isoform X3 [Pararge aegeria]